MNINIISRLRNHRFNITPSRTNYGLKLSLPAAPSEDELLRQLAKLPPSVFTLPSPQRIALDFQDRTVSRKLILHLLQSVVWHKNITIAAWLSTNPETLALLNMAGLNTTEPEPEELLPPQTPPMGGAWTAPTRVVYTSMRSGQRIDADGDVIVWGHVKAGAEIAAGGSIMVAGRLLGVVHAGAGGREDVIVWAGSFETPQVRIADKLCYADAVHTACWRKGVMITLEDGMPTIREYKFFTGGNKQ